MRGSPHRAEKTRSGASIRSWLCGLSRLVTSAAARRRFAAPAAKRLDDPFLAEDFETLAKSALISGALFCYRLVVPREEAALGLEADSAFVDVALEQWRRTICVGAAGFAALGHSSARVPAR